MDGSTTLDMPPLGFLACFVGVCYLPMLSGAKLAPESETEKASHDVAVHQTLDTFQAKNHGAFPL